MCTGLTNGFVWFWKVWIELSLQKNSTFHIFLILFWQAFFWMRALLTSRRQYVYYWNTSFNSLVTNPFQIRRHYVRILTIIIYGQNPTHLIDIVLYVGNKDCWDLLSYIYFGSYNWVHTKINNKTSSQSKYFLFYYSLLFSIMLCFFVFVLFFFFGKV